MARLPHKRAALPEGLYRPTQGAINYLTQVQFKIEFLDRLTSKVIMHDPVHRVSFVKLLDHSNPQLLNYKKARNNLTYIKDLYDLCMQGAKFIKDEY